MRLCLCIRFFTDPRRHSRAHTAICSLRYFDFFIVDLAATLKKLVNFTEYLAALQDFAESLKERYENEPWFASQSISEMFAAVKHRAQLKQGEISERLLNKIDSLSERKAAVERFIKSFRRCKMQPTPFDSAHKRTAEKTFKITARRKTMEKRYGKIILASVSPRRKQILKSLGIPFYAFAPPFDEVLPEGTAGEHAAEYCAVQKAQNV